MKVGLIGTFDVENFGDCMFPELYSKLLTRDLGPVEISLYSPTDTAAQILSFDKVKALPKDQSQAELGKLDADTLILIGGETIGHGHSSGTFNFQRSTLSAYLRLWLSPILAVKCAPLRPSFFAAHCVGSIKMPDQLNREISNCLAAADRVRFRDHFSAKWLSLDGNDFGVDIDPMFLIDAVCSQDEWVAHARASLPEGVELGNYIAAQISVGYGHNDLEAWAKAVSEIARMENKPVVLTPICHFLEDTRLLGKILPLLQAQGIEAYIAPGLRNVKQTAALIAKAAGYVGSSLHGAVTAVAFGKPMAILGHSLDGKHAGTLASVGVEGCVAIDCNDLPGCYRTSYNRNKKKDRERAQSRANASIRNLIEAIQNNDSASNAGKLEIAAAELISLERRSHPFIDIKRFLLRTIRVTPFVKECYERWRLWKIFRGV